LLHYLPINTTGISFLGCTGNTFGERLARIGMKVGIKCHSQLESFFDMAANMAMLLRSIELSVLNDDTWVIQMIQSETNITANQEQVIMLKALQNIITNWEKATGDCIKGIDVGIRGAVAFKRPVPAT